MFGVAFSIDLGCADCLSAYGQEPGRPAADSTLPTRTVRQRKNNGAGAKADGKMHKQTGESISGQAPHSRPESPRMQAWPRGKKKNILKPLPLEINLSRHYRRLDLPRQFISQKRRMLALARHCLCLDRPARGRGEYADVSDAPCG